MNSLTPQTAAAGDGHAAAAPEGAGTGWLSALVFFCALGILAGMRWFQPALDRPLDYDEWHTLEYYGWAGLTPAGDMKLIRRAADFESLPRPNARQLGLGLFRALGVWKEPNNQVPHSVLVNLTSAFQRSPRFVRVPAFAGGVLFAILVYFLSGPVLKWHWAAPFAGICAYVQPYVSEFSLDARGYTLMLALAVLLLVLGVGLASRPQGTWRSAFMVAVATVSVFNVISLAADWVLPAYVALAVFPPAALDGTWKKLLGVHGLAIAGLCGLFAVDRLPALYLASQRFGETIGSVADFGNWMWRTGTYLFPGSFWVLFGIAGVVGLAAMAGNHRDRFFAALALAVLLFNGLHFVVSRRCAYPRTCGYLLIPLLIGLAFLVERLVRRVSPAPRLGVWLTFFVGATALATIGPTRVGVSAETSAPASASGLPQSGVYALMQDYDYAAVKFLPERWMTWQDRPAANEIHSLAISLQWSERGVSAVARSSEPPLSVGPDPENRVLVFPADASEFLPEASLPESPLVVAIWYPDQARMGMDPGPLMELVERPGVVAVRRTARLQANYDYYLRPYAFEFLVEGAQARETLQVLLNDALRQFGGTALIIDPHTAGDQS